jgi:DNA-binding phage protein
VFAQETDNFDQLWLNNSIMDYMRRLPNSSPITLLRARAEAQAELLNDALASGNAAYVARALGSFK